jgi:hypothetical protein
MIGTQLDRFVQAMNIACRPKRTAIAVPFDRISDIRFPDFATMDFRVDKTFTMGGLKRLPSLDLFKRLQRRHGHGTDRCGQRESGASD